ncbi:MAG: hypothetical protein AAFW87_11240 [Pseudomonadota bacterium]
MRLFTFIVERAGGTYCSQHLGADFDEAAKLFVGHALEIGHLNVASPKKERLLNDVRDAVALEGLANAFCASHLDGDNELWVINIVETVVPEEDSKALGAAQ